MIDGPALFAALHRRRRALLAGLAGLALSMGLAITGPIFGAFAASRIADLLGPALVHWPEVARLGVIYAGSLLWSLPFGTALVVASAVWHRSVAHAARTAGIEDPATGILGPARTFVLPAGLAIVGLVGAVAVGLQVVAARAADPELPVWIFLWLVSLAPAVAPGLVWAGIRLQDRRLTRRLREGTLRASDLQPDDRPFPLVGAEPRGVVAARLWLAEGELERAERAIVAHLQNHGVSVRSSLVLYGDIQRARQEIQHAAQIYAAAAWLDPFQTAALRRLGELELPGSGLDVSAWQAEVAALETGWFGVNATSRQS
jgi:hypothetical protein